MTHLLMNLAEVILSETVCFEIKKKNPSISVKSNIVVLLAEPNPETFEAVMKSAQV